MLAIKLRTFWF